MKGDTVTLTWSSTGTSGCTASGGWSGSIAASGSQAVSVGSTGSVPFTISCNGAGGTATAETKINAYERVAINLALSRTDVITYQASTLTWSVANADSCTASGAWSGTKALTGSLTIPTTAEASNTYELSCANAGGTIKQAATLKVAKPALVDGGLWTPTLESDITSTVMGSLSGTFSNIVKMGNSPYYGVVAASFTFVRPAPTTPLKVIAGFLAPDATGLVKIDNSRATPDALTGGAGSIVVADMNSDGYQDIVMLPYNESPFYAAPSTVFWGSSSGTFRKETLADRIMAQDAQLAVINGKPYIFAVSGLDVNGDGLKSPYYYYANGKLTWTETPIGGTTYVKGTSTYSPKLVEPMGCVWDSIKRKCGSYTVSAYDFVNFNLASTDPQQRIAPYMTTLPQFSGVESFLGKGLSEVNSLYSRDLNGDGHEDLLGVEDMWTMGSDSFPTALAVFINDKTGKFVGATSKLNPDMPFQTSGLGKTPTFVDLDGSGIESILWPGMAMTADPTRLADSLFINDGTGRLYLALQKEFTSIAADVKQFVINMKLPWGSPELPRFIGLPQPDGSVNYVAEVSVPSLTSKGMAQRAYRYVNVPLRYNPKTDFTRNVTVADRNGSPRIRTWAGDDVISDSNATSATSIDGGLGLNKVTYSGPSTAYSVAKNADGTITVTTTVSGSYPSVKDTLKNIQLIQFTDKSVALGARARLN